MTERPDASAELVQRLLDEQLKIMRKQLELIRAVRGADREIARALDDLQDLQERLPAATPTSPLAPAPEDERQLAPVAGAKLVPLTDVQRDVWITCQLSDAGSAAYDLVATLHMRGELQVDALERAVRQLVERHDALRTTFDATGEHQIVHPEMAVALRVIDVSEAPESERATRVATIRKGEHEVEYDLVEGPLFRATLIRSGPTDHTLVLAAHHLICDGTSFGVLQRELSTLYTALLRGVARAPLTKATTYSDYVALRAERSVASEPYWLGLYQEPPPQLDLPGDHPRPPTRSYEYGTMPVALGSASFAAVKQLAAELGVTPFIVLLGAWEILLHRLSGQAEFANGIYVAGQQSMGVRDLVGLCASLLPLRVRIEPDESVGAYLARLKQSTYDAFDNQDFGVGRLASALRLPRDASRPMVVSTVMTLETPTKGIDFDGLEVTELITPRRFGAYDFEAYLTESADDLTIDFQYSTVLLEAETVRRWQRHYVNLLREMATRAASPVADLRLMDAAERREVLQRWNDTQAPVPELAVHEQIELEVARHPERVAIVGPGHRLTYGQLNARANQLARHLREAGVEAERLVGVHIDRSPDVIVAMLAVHKAGGAFVPLDPIFPRERLATIASDVGLHVLITERRLAEALGQVADVVVLLDDDAEAIAQHDPSDLGISPGPADLAYIISTSGSTGTPKGVEIEHRSLINQLAAMRERPGLEVTDVLLSVTTMSFDPFLLEAFGPLLVGATIVLADARQAADGMWLRDRLAEGDITVLQATPATWQMLIDAGWQGSPRLKALCGGEALTQEQARAITSRVRELWNVYGTTEGTVWQSSSLVDPEAGLIPIGPPIANTEFHVLDRSLEPQPPGVVGVLYDGGVGVARGYRNRPELTAERFIEHSFDGEPERRLYNTGDLARRHPDGAIEYLGRDDFQVKIRGFRIELGEIETVLARHPAVRECTVAARPGIDGAKRLVAYVVPAADERATVSDLRMYLRESLPEYMVPAAFVELEALPLSSNRKVDRSKLPDPDQQRPDLATGLVLPRTETETAIAGIWQRLLGLEQVGVEDNFFDLGGDSLLALRCVIDANRSGVSLAPNSIFRYQTIAELALVADDAAHDVEQGIVTGPTPLTPAQLRFLIERDTPDPHHWNIPTLVEGERFDPLALQTALDAVVQHHDALRLRLWQEDGRWQQETAPPMGPTPLETHDLSGLDEVGRRELVLRVCTDIQSSLELDRGLMLKAARFVGGPGDSDRLFVAIHHFAIDGLTWTVFWEDLEEAYRQAQAGQAITLPPKTTSIKAWSEQLHHLVREPRVTAATDAWLRLPWHEVVPLPADHMADPAANTNASAATAELELGTEDTRRLLAHSTRPEHIILAALGASLSGWTGSSTVLIDVLGHGRDAVLEGVNLSRTVGFTLAYNPLVLSDRAWDATTETLDSVAAQVDAAPEGFTFELLRFLSPDPGVRERLTALPRADLLFNYAGSTARDGAQWNEISAPTGPAASPRGLRQYPLAVRARLAPNLKITFVYSTALHRSETIEARVAQIDDMIRRLVADDVPAGNVSR